MKVWWPGAAVAVVVAGVGLLNAGSADAPRLAFVAGAGSGGVAALLGGATLVLRRRSRLDFPDGGLVSAVRAWDAGDLNAIQAWAADLVSQHSASHAVRTASLCRHMADQLAVRPGDVDGLLLAALAHVAPAAFETGEGRCTGFSPQAIDHAARALEKAGHPEAALVIAQVGERWDGLGSPAGLLGEASSLRGRILATSCAFDLASSAGLDAGLAAIRAGSGSAFDPVVAAELLHLFREPWQLQQAA